MGDGNGFRVGVSATEVGTAAGLLVITGGSATRRSQQLDAAFQAFHAAADEQLLIDQHRRFLSFQDGSAPSPADAKTLASYYDFEFPAQDINERLGYLLPEQRAALRCSNALVNNLVEEGRWDWAVFDMPAEALRAITENPSLLSVVTGQTESVLRYKAVHRCNLEDIPSDIVNTQRLDAEGRRNYQLSLAKKYEVSSARWLWTARLSGALAAGFVAVDVGAHYMCNGRSIFQIAFTDQSCR